MKRHGQVRIIAGQWRSRLLAFPLTAGLRPSPDAVRETLFNWLQAEIAGRHCLDLFAGSGALGFEAVSRAAERVDMVESEPTAARALLKNRAALGAERQVCVHALPAQQFLAQCRRRYDLVFLDPPFDGPLLQLACYRLHRYRLLEPAAMVYIESPRPVSGLPLMPGWRVIRQKHVGRVTASLIDTQPPPDGCTSVEQSSAPPALLSPDKGGWGG